MIKEIKLDNTFMSLVYVDNAGEMFPLTHIVVGKDAVTDTGVFNICNFLDGYLGNKEFHSTPCNLVNDLYVKVDKEYLPVVKVAQAINGEMIVTAELDDTLSLIATLSFGNHSLYFMVHD